MDPAAQVTEADPAMVRGRQAYRYLPARLMAAGDLPAKIEMWDTLKLRVDSPEAWDTVEGRAKASSIELDRFHGRLLASGNDDDVLHGIASVYFWGFASGTDHRPRLKRALGKVKVLRDGHPRIPHQRPNEILSYFKTARTCLIENRDPSRALLAAMNLRFASKLLAFLDPAQCGVYDRRISDLMAASPLPERRSLHVPTLGEHHHRKESQARVYGDFCAYLAAEAARLNHLGILWRDWDGMQHRWRAVDVERSLFAGA